MKSEIRNKHEFRIFKSLKNVSNFMNSTFGFVSDFDTRISDFLPSRGRR